MVQQGTLLVTLVMLVDLVPMPDPPARRDKGRPKSYSDRLFLKALVIMIVKHLHTVHELLTVLEQPTQEMLALRALLTQHGRYPTRRTWERRLKALPATLPSQIGCLGRHLVAIIEPWEGCGRAVAAVAVDSTLLRARGGVWHTKDRELGMVPHTQIDTEAHWTKSGWHGWVYGWKLRISAAEASVWIPLSAELTPANIADPDPHPQVINGLVGELPGEVRFVLGDRHYNRDDVRAACQSGVGGWGQACERADLVLVTSR